VQKCQWNAREHDNLSDVTFAQFGDGQSYTACNDRSLTGNDLNVGAGLWDIARIDHGDHDEIMDSCTIMTCDPNEVTSSTTIACP